jgi:hypothetical protein
VDVEEECKGWSKATTNRHGVQGRVCKCARAQILKVTRLGLQDMFLPILDGEALPPYYKLAEAKDAIEAAAEGRVLPKPTRPFRRGPLEYRNIGEEAGAESYERTKAWMSGRVTGVQESTAEALTTLGLGPHPSLAEFKQAVRQLKKELHPDHNPGDDAAAERFRQVVAAAELLTQAGLFSAESAGV